MTRTYTYKKKQVVLYLGETTSSIHFVKKGIVRAYAILSNGSETIVAIFGPGDYFPSSIDSSRLPLALFYYDMVTDGELERISYEDFYPETAVKLCESGYFDRRYTGAMLHINALIQLNASEKLLHTLRYLTIRSGEDLNGKVFTRISMKLTQQDIADLCNVSRETANIELSKLRTNNVIIERKKYYSVDIKRLNKILGEDAVRDVNLQ